MTIYRTWARLTYAQTSARHIALSQNVRDVRYRHSTFSLCAYVGVCLCDVHRMTRASRRSRYWTRREQSLQRSVVMPDVSTQSNVRHPPDCMIQWVWTSGCCNVTQCLRNINVVMLHHTKYHKHYETYVIHQRFTRMTKIMHQQRSRWEPLHQLGNFPYSVTIATKIFQTLYRGNNYTG